MFSWDWLDAVPLVSFVDGDEYPQTIFFDIVDGAVFLDLWEIDVVSFCFSSWILSPDGGPFYDAWKGVVLDSVNVCGLKLRSSSAGVCHDGETWLNVTHQRGISCDLQVLGVKSYQDFSSGVHKYWPSRAQSKCERVQVKSRDTEVLWGVRLGGQWLHEVMFRRSCWYYTGSQVYRYKLGKDDLYTFTKRFVRDKPMTQVGIAWCRMKSS